MKINKIQENYLYLFFIQGANSIIPIFLLYYLSNVIGPKNLGTLNFSQSFINYFILIVSFGFDLSATREIAKNEKNRNEIFNTIILSKFLLFIFSSVLFTILILLNSKFKINAELHIYTFLGTFGLLLLPTWFFQGIQNLKTLSIFNALTKIIFGFCSIIIIKEEKDYWYYNLLLSIAQVMVGIMSFVHVYKRYQFIFYIPHWLNIANEIKKSSTVFFTLAVVNIYTNSNIFILGIYKTPYDVGVLSAAFKIEAIFQTLFIAMISQALFPAIGAAFSKSFETGIELWKSTSRVVILINLAISIGLYIYSNDIIIIFYKERFLESVYILRLLSPMPFIISISSVYGIQLMLNLKKDKQYFLFTCIGAIVGIIINIIYINKFSYYAVCTSWLVAEILVSILCFIYANSKILIKIAQ